MGGSPKAPPPPDYKPFLEATKLQIASTEKLMQESLTFAREAYAQDSVENKRMTDIFEDQARTQKEWAEKDRERWETTFKPIEDRLVAEAEAYDTPEKRQQAAAERVANVAQQFEGAREAQEQKLASYGIAPGQLRSAAADTGALIERAKAGAGEAAAGRQRVEDVGRTLKFETANMGRGLPAGALQAMQGATGAGQAAIGGNLATTASGQSGIGRAPEWGQIQQGYFGNWGGALRDQGNYNAQIYQTKMANRSSPWQMAGSLLGAGAKIGMGFMQEGGEIPAEASPSGGAIPDDVPIMAQAGEYVIPKDVVERKGTEFFDRFIEKTRNPQQGKGQGKQQPPDQEQMDPAMMEALMAGVVPQRGIPMGGPPAGGGIPMQSSQPQRNFREGGFVRA